METKKKELLEELKEKFESTKQELGFKASFDDLNKVFFIEDSVLSTGFVSENYSRQLCSRIVDTFMNWNNYLHSLIMPIPNNMINMNESKMFDEAERKEMLSLMSASMALTSTNMVNGLTKDKVGEGKFVDEAVKFWNERFKPGVEKIVRKINENWKSK